MLKNNFLPEESRNSKKSTWIPLVFVLLFFVMAMMSRLAYQARSGNFRIEPPAVMSGDEPHYLIVVNSLLFDHDLKLQDDYARVRQGGLEAGRRIARRNLDHHTFLVDTRTKDHALWGNIFDRRFPEACGTQNCSGFRRKSTQFSETSFVVERSCHPVAFPAILAALLAPTFPQIFQVEGRVSWIIVIFSWGTLLVTYLIARRAGLSPPVSILAVLLLFLASPWLAYSRSYFSEPLIGFLLILGLWAMQRSRMILAALMVILAMAIKPPFALVGLGWIAERLMARQFRQAFTLMGLLLLGGAALMGFNYWQVGIPIVGGNASFDQMWKLPNPFPTLLDYKFGLFIFVPWALLPWVGMFLSFKKSSEQNTLLRQMAFPTFLFWFLLSFYFSLGASAFGPRFWVPWLPWFALAAILMAQKFGRKFLWIMVPLALAGFLVAVPGAVIYPNSWDNPPHFALKKLMTTILR